MPPLAVLGVLNPRPAPFLDHLAKLFTRAHQGSGRHVCAAVFLRTLAGSPKIYIAKNGGLDKEDEDLLNHLQEWMRNLPRGDDDDELPETEIMTDRILEHNLDFISQHISRIAQMKVRDLEALTTLDWIRPLIRRLRVLCVNFWCGLTTDIRPIVDLDDTLRKELKTDALTEDQRQDRKSISYVGRLQAAHRTIRREARADPSFKDLGLQPVNHKRYKSFPSLIIKQLMDQLNAECGMPLPAPVCRRRSFRTVCHAEMQLVYHLEHKIENETPHFNIGCSKKACFLCHMFLTRYNSRYGWRYQNRGCSDKIFTN
jgi:hypothetical protein